MHTTGVCKCLKKRDLQKLRQQLLNLILQAEYLCLSKHRKGNANLSMCSQVYKTFMLYSVIINSFCKQDSPTFMINLFSICWIVFSLQGQTNGWQDLSHLGFNVRFTPLAVMARIRINLKTNAVVHIKCLFHCRDHYVVLEMTNF